LRAIVQRLSPGTTRWLLACSAPPGCWPGWPPPGWPCPPGGVVVEVVVVGSVVVGGRVVVGWLVVGGWLVIVVDVVVAACFAAELFWKLITLNASAIITSGCQRVCMDNLRPSDRAD
jgi:hypothetical protein